ncbi:MAG: hypothetical protein HUJ72_01210, partial [Blautia sp.]|nr:hypothetical protein [Blautia sp.]
QYNHSDDVRINPVEEYNEISEADLKEMMTELWGSCTDEDLEEYYSKYVDRSENDLSYSYGAGDFGDAGMAVFMFSTASFDDEYAILNGNVWVYDMDSYEYAPQGRFEVKFLKESANDIGIHTFVELTVCSQNNTAANR